MAEVVRNLQSRYGHIVGINNEFVVDGDLESAFRVLKDMFEPPKISTSGPIKPMTQKEIDLENNQPIVNTLEEIIPHR